MDFDTIISEICKEFNTTPVLILTQRRFKCSVCDYRKMIIAGGGGDEKHYPQKGIEEVKKNFEQEEINRLGRPL